MNEAKIQTNGRLYAKLKASRVRYNYLAGGASSGKSYCLAQFLTVERFLSKDRYGIVSVRKTRPAVKASCWELAVKHLDMAAEWVGMRPDELYESNKSDLILKAKEKPNNTWRFIGFDNLYKVRSMENINQVHVEEVCAIGNDAAFHERDMMQLDLICRAHGLQQLWFSFNKVDPVGNKWMKDRIEHADAKPNSLLIEVTHLDNRFLQDESRAAIEELIETDAEYDKIYRQNKWATPTALIYTKWDIVPDMPEKYTQRIWGLDFGYSTNPAALTEIRFVATHEVYIRECIHQTHLTIPELIEMMKLIVPMNEKVVADSAEPGSIQQIRNAGFNMFGAFKGPDSVRFGIRTLQGVMQHITADSTNIIKEIGGYKWGVDIDGNVKQPPKPVELLDHAMDGNRYAITNVLGLTKAGLLVVTDEVEPTEHSLCSEDDGWVGDKDDDDDFGDGL